MLAQLDVWKYWKETTAYKNDRHLLPKDLDGGVAKLTLLHSVRRSPSLLRPKQIVQMSRLKARSSVVITIIEL